jgi:hypothetical protein
VKNECTRDFELNHVKYQENSMSLKVECGWARAYVRKSKYSASLTRENGEGQAKFWARGLGERYRLYYEQFKEYPQLLIDKKDFKRITTVLDSKFGSWRSREDKESYLQRFSPENWTKEKTITKEGKNKHALTDCKACQLFNSNFQRKFPVTKWPKYKVLKKHIF